MSVFGLNGADENSATFALGWVLEQCREFRSLLLAAVFGMAIDGNDIAIHLQKFGKEDGGYTDLEIRGKGFHAILEAKKGWTIPSLDQLAKYRPRMQNPDGNLLRLISVSAAGFGQARRLLPEQVDSVDVIHLSWGDLQRLGQKASATTGSFEQKLWLRQFIQHLQEFISMSRVNDNQVYVVSLSIEDIRPGNAYTWVDVVERDGSYFHPVGDTWPVEPSNYIGFRYHGQLQSVHHIADFEVVKDVSSINPAWCPTDRDHFVYRLGPPMRPVREIRTGNIYRTGRVKCAIDTLLSGEFNTISDARDESQRRLNEADSLEA